MTISSFISLVIGFAGAIIAFATLWHKFQDDAKNETKETVEAHAHFQSQIDALTKVIGSKLDGIDSGIRDLKAENRIMRQEISSANETAIKALDLAEAAHRRLDRAGIDAAE